MIKPFHRLHPMAPELAWIHGTTCHPKGQETSWSLAEVSIHLQEGGPPPEAGEGERQKAGNAGLGTGLAREGKGLTPPPLQAQLSPLATNKSGPGVQCGKEHLAVWLAVQPGNWPKGS